MAEEVPKKISCASRVRLRIGDKALLIHEAAATSHHAIDEFLHTALNAALPPAPAEEIPFDYTTHIEPIAPPKAPLKEGKK